MGIGESINAAMASLGTDHAADHTEVAVHTQIDCDRSRKIYCEASDLLFWFREFVHPSGIQRAQVEILTRLIAMDEEDTSYIVVYRVPGTQELLELSTPTVYTLLEYVRGGTVERHRLDELLALTLASGRIVHPSRGDTLFIIGAFWLFPTTVKLLQSLGMDGVRIGLMIYDIIPTRNPEYCESNLVRAFRSLLVGVGPMIDFAISISQHVANDYKQFRKECGHSVVPVFPVPLAVEREIFDGEQNSNVLEDLGGRFVLQVGTLEVRKNPRFAYEVWKQLVAEGTPNLPTLVFVGRIGWRVNDFIEELQATNFLGGRVKLISSASDADLAALYSHAEFTFFPSFNEGWGLPLAESLANGVPSITSNLASMPEIAGDLADYIDPLNVRSGVDAVKRLLDAEYMTERRHQIASRLEKRSWDDVAESFHAAMASGLRAEVHPKGTASFPLEPGKLTVMGSDDPATSLSDSPGFQVLRSGWHDNEDWGTWSASDRSQMNFTTDVETSVRVYLVLRSPPWLTNHRARILDRDGQTLKDLPIRAPGADFFTSATVTPDDSGQVTLTLETVGDIVAVGPDPRRLHVGVVALGYAPANDLEARANLTEAIAFGDYLLPPIHAKAS